jgi:hypothetical protein
LPSDGEFNYVHIDFNGTGGFVHMIENVSKYTKNKALEVIGGAMGKELMNLNIPLRKEKAQKSITEIKKRFGKFDWTKFRK